MRPAPADAVLAWFAAQSAQSLFTTTVTEAEILYGVALLPEGQRRTAFMEAAIAMFEQDFADRVLPFDRAAARVYAALVVRRREAGTPIAQFDAQIAAIARSRGAAIATRNVSDFDNLDIDILNPWAIRK